MTGMPGRRGRDVIVIGASAGGVGTLQKLLSGLPPGLPAAVLVVLHTATTDVPLRLPNILARSGPLPVAYAVPGQRLTPGIVVLAPADQHLVLTPGDILRLHRGPHVHGNRPAADPLFHSAARTCGGRVVAVVLSGVLRDAADGAAAVAAAGGAVLVQDPGEAPFPSMPQATLAQVPQARPLSVEDLGAAVARLAATAPPPATAPATTTCADGLDVALWLAVSRLHAYASTQRQLAERVAENSPLRRSAELKAYEAVHAAELIATHVLPAYATPAAPAGPAGPPGPATDSPAAGGRS
ncbi:chemotaxis protein CheB [Nonomuraea sp. NPDC050783]|uniref:chemotaxis protein CheB n=1 Tax=Nonomuraea sp. NPDC050783 TaxID=3154634 RepID=UPI00346609BA